MKGAKGFLWGAILLTLAFSGAEAVPAFGGQTEADTKIFPTGEPGTATIHEPGWDVPIKLAFNDDGWEDSPYITRDGAAVIFFYHPFPDLLTGEDDITEIILSDPERAVALGIDGKLYQSPRPFETKTVHPISDNDHPSLECCLYISLAGDFYYGSTRESFEQGRGVPVTVYRNGTRLDFGTGGEEANPHYCDARDEMWFDCPGDENLCVMREAMKNDFKGVVTLAPFPLNAEPSVLIEDAQAYLTDDCNTLYFTSNRDSPEGIIGIYRSHRIGEFGWSDPEPFITAPTPVAELSMTADGTELVFAQIFWREDGGAGLDIYYSRKRDPSESSDGVADAN